MIAVDTSVLIDLFRGRATPAVSYLRQLETESIPFAIPVICCQEVLQGAKDEHEWNVLKTYLETQILLSPADAWSTHIAAARIFYDCRREGLTVRGSMDCTIAQLALENGAILLHDDDDYDRIASVRPLRTTRG